MRVVTEKILYDRKRHCLARGVRSNIRLIRVYTCIIREIGVEKFLVFLRDFYQWIFAHTMYKHRQLNRGKIFFSRMCNRLFSVGFLCWFHANLRGRKKTWWFCKKKKRKKMTFCINDIPGNTNNIWRTFRFGDVHRSLRHTS